MNPRVRTVALLLFVSGMCALIFQTAWLREFRLIFGASTPASAAVLAIFMGGLGLGNALLGRRADAVRNPLQLYSGFEIGISLLCGLSPFLVQLVRFVYISIGGQETLGIFGATLLRLLFATLVIGVPTFLMGGTLPAAARAVTRADDHSRRDVGLLYGLNTLGAVLGAVLSTFFLLEILGTRATLWAACAFNLLNALAAWKLSQRWGPLPLAEADEAAKATAESMQRAAARRDQPAAKKKTDKKHQGAALPAEELAPPLTRTGLPPMSPTFFYVSAGIVGFVFFLMELVWYRMLGPILGGSTFTFGLILGVALAGIGIGGALYPVIYRDRQPDLRSFAMTLAWEALAIAFAFALGDRLAILALVMRSLALYGFYGQALGWLAIALIVVFPAALVSGIQFPVLIALIGQGSRDVGKQLGQAFGWNTVGAMVGSLAGGFGLLTLLSATGVWKAVVIALGLFALVVLLIEYRRTRRMGRLLSPLAIVALAAVCVGMLGPTAVWRHNGIGAGRANFAGSTQNELRNFFNNSRRHIIWEADGRESSVAISVQNGAAFIVNGKSDGNAVTDAGTQIMLGVLGGLLHGEPREGLIVGLGTGESAGWLASLPSIERVDVVELEPAIQEMAAVCAPLNHNVLAHPKVHLTINDAREVLQTTRRKYDVIASEPSNPYRTGVSSLYTREFYLAARERLNERGIFIQWLQGYEVDLPTVRSVLCTLEGVFPNIEIWETNPADLVLVCSLAPLDYSAEDLQQRMAEPAMREALRVAWRTRTMEGVLAHLVADRRYAQQVARQGDGVINTDDRNILEYGFARTVGRSGGFSIEGLRTEARTVGFHRQQQLEKSVDWERVEDCRLAYYAVIGEVPLAADTFAGDQGKRVRFLSALFAGGDPAAAVRHWDSQPREPYDLPETLALALARAQLGDERALALLEPIRADVPVDAAAIEAVLLARQNKPVPAIAQFRKAFLLLRDDATATRLIIEHTMRAAGETVEKNPTITRPLYDALHQPLAVFFFEDRRRGLLAMIGQRLGGREFADAMYLLEPYPPWDTAVLTWRVQAYQQTNHPLLARARRELAENQRLSPEASVLQLPAAPPAPPAMPLGKPQGPTALSAAGK